MITIVYVYRMALICVSIVQDDLQSRHEKKLKEVRNALKAVGEQSPDGLKMIDTLQRLGVDFHFPEEIEAILRTHCTIPYNQHHNLHDLALRFRLLRQEGFHVHPGMFIPCYHCLITTFYIRS